MSFKPDQIVMNDRFLRKHVFKYFRDPAPPNYDFGWNYLFKQNIRTRRLFWAQHLRITEHLNRYLLDNFDWYFEYLGTDEDVGGAWGDIDYGSYEQLRRFGRSASSYGESGRKMRLYEKFYPRRITRN